MSKLTLSKEFFDNGIGPKLLDYVDKPSLSGSYGHAVDFLGDFDGSQNYVMKNYMNEGGRISLFPKTAKAVRDYIEKITENTSPDMLLKDLKVIENTKNKIMEWFKNGKIKADETGSIATTEFENIASEFDEVGDDKAIGHSVFNDQIVSYVKTDAYLNTMEKIKVLCNIKITQHGKQKLLTGIVFVEPDIDKSELAVLTIHPLTDPQSIAQHLSEVYNALGAGSSLLGDDLLCYVE